MRPQQPMSSKPPEKGTPSDSSQTQFLNVITRDEATARFREHLVLAPLGKESTPLREALNRVLAEDVLAEVDPFMCPGCGNVRTSCWLRLGLCRECGQDPAQRRSGYGPEAPRQPAIAVLSEFSPSGLDAAPRRVVRQA